MDACVLKNLFVPLMVMALLSACAPKWEPPAGYRGGILLAADIPSTVLVKKGDTVYAIARRYNVTMKSIISQNKLQPPYMLFPGQDLALVPPMIHVISRGDTLYSISRRYGVDTHILAARNGIQSPYTIQVNQTLVIPDAYTTASVALNRSDTGSSVKVQGRIASENSRSKLRENKQAKSAPPAIPPQPLAPPARSGSRFAWPVQGKVTARFGSVGKGLHNDGINILVREGTNVRASENGVVAYSGNELKGFGNLLLVKHDDGWMTAYAHNRNLFVKRGERVQKGQIVAKVGRTGNVRTAQLHFEIRRGTKAVDPLKHLITPQS